MSEKKATTGTKNELLEKQIDEKFEEIKKKYPQVPELTIGGIKRYVIAGIRPGHFLTNVLSNKLVDSFQYADNNNLNCMYQIVRIVYNEIPGDCWGSKEIVKNWSGLINERN